MSRSSSRPRHGFTLTELLVVIAIIAVLAVIAFSSYKSMLESARAVRCTGNLREIFTGIQGYVQQNNGQYPPSRGPVGADSFWFAAIGPHLSEGRRFDQSKVNSEEPVVQEIPFACPSCEKHGWGGAGIDVAINGFQVGATVNTNNVTTALRSTKVSEPSTTLLVADAAGAGGGGSWQIGWRIGQNSNFSGAAQSIATRHKGRANVLYFDGHVGQVTAGQLKDPKFLERLRGPQF